MIVSSTLSPHMIRRRKHLKRFDDVRKFLRNRCDAASSVANARANCSLLTKNLIFALEWGARLKFVITMMSPLGTMFASPDSARMSVFVTFTSSTMPPPSSRPLSSPPSRRW